MEELVRRAAEGDKEAFVELINLQKQSMYKTAWVYLRNEEDIADAMQETVLTCFEKIHTLRNEDYFKTWLIRILINKCNDILRKRLPYSVFEDFSEGRECEKLEACEWKELLLCLDEDTREIVQLYYYDELSVGEIAKLLEMNRNTVATRLSRARQKLKKEL